MRNTGIIIPLSAFIFVFSLLCSCNGETRSVEDFNFDWKFVLGDDSSYCEPGFDDSSWRSLHLPHDWSIEGEFSADNPSTPSGGALPGGIGWYRKHFKASPSRDDRRCFVEFDGVFMNSTVFVNGTPFGPRPYGYSSFSYDITDALKDGDNVIAVRCDNADQPNSRWYAGCGIYRNVRLLKVNPVHVVYNGVFITTQGDKAFARAAVSGDASSVTFSIKDTSGVEVASVDGMLFQQDKAENVYGKANTSGDVSENVSGRNDAQRLWTTELRVDSPHLWDIEDTYLYTLSVTVRVGGKVVDTYEQPFGYRTVGWDVDKGFFLNGRQLKLLGVCMHHDMGCLGTAFHPRAVQRQLEKLKSMGCNAIRTSHNPPAPQLLDMCDRMGFLVIDEAMDMWRKRKTQYDYSRFFDEWHVRDVQDMVLRDRNHPCVIMWSVGNEILEQWNSDSDDLNNLDAAQANLLLNFLGTLPQYDGGDVNPNTVLASHMVALVKELDTTRAVTAGCNETAPTNNLLRSGAFDVYGFNYHTWDYDKVREWYPDVPLYGSETASSLNSRGFYPQPSTDVQRQPREWWMTYETPHHQCPAYDAMCAPWADLHQHAWAEIKSRDYMAGTFVWTGFDYLGEPTPYGWPSRSSYFGVFDLAGFPKDIYYMYKSEWTDDDVLHLFPHWNWNEGDTVDMWCWYGGYGGIDEVELLVNGKSFGRSSKEGERFHAQWLNVPFEPGTIEAVAYRDGREVARQLTRTAGKPETIHLEADRDTISADGYDLSYVTVTVKDVDGLDVPTADDMLSFRVDGCGELFGVDNGNAADTLSLKGSRKALFAGKALAVVRSIKGDRGKATLTVSNGTKESSIEITVK